MMYTDTLGTYEQYIVRTAMVHGNTVYHCISLESGLGVSDWLEGFPRRPLSIAMFYPNCFCHVLSASKYVRLPHCVAYLRALLHIYPYVAVSS